MKLEIVENEYNRYIIKSNNYYNKIHIAHELNITPKQYDQILLNHNAIFPYHSPYFPYFENIQDANNTLEELLPLIIITTLMGG